MIIVKMVIYHFMLHLNLMEPKGFKNVVSFDCESERISEVLTINKSGLGVIGYCHKRNGRFGCNGLVGVYKMKRKLNDLDIYCLQEQLIKQLNHKFLHFGVAQLKTLKIYLPKQINNEENEEFKEYDQKVQEIIKQSIKTTKVWKRIKVSDYFDFIKPKKVYKIYESREGQYPLISTSSQNNGVVKYIDDYSYDSNEDFLTIARVGSVGSCFIQNGKVAVTNGIIILKPKNKDLDLSILSLILKDHLTQIYYYGNNLTDDKLKDTVFNYPIIEN